MSFLKKIMSGSKRRSYLGLGVSNFNFNTRACLLGIIDTLCPKNQKNQEFLGSEEISFKDLWKMQRRAKLMLSMRSIEEYPELVEQLDRRKDWNRENRKIENLLDLFPSLKYSYSSQLPKSYSKGVVDICRSEETGNTYVGDIARSHSIRLDPVDSPKELKKYRLRIQRVIYWSYKNDLVPVMMTLTMFHRWDNLAPLCRALRLAWSGLFGNGQAGYDRKCYIGLQGFIRRMEETLNDGSEFKLGGGVSDEVACNFDNVGIEGKVCGLGNVAADESAQRSVARARNDLSNIPQSDATSLTNAGWHPHYHVILLIPRDKVQVLSDYEETLKDIWLNLVCKFYNQEVGKDVPSAYYNAFKEHGLVLSRYKSEEHARRCGNRHGKAGDLLEVHDGKYLAKMLGYDSPEVFGGDSEMSSFNSKSNLKCDADGIPHTAVLDANYNGNFDSKWYSAKPANINASAVTRSLTIYADDSDNVIRTSKGYSYVYAGKGNDIVYFNEGSDSLYYYNGDGNETIYNYDIEDSIYLNSSEAKLNNISYSGNDAILNLTSGNTITIKNAKNTAIRINGYSSGIYNQSSSSTSARVAEDYWFVEDDNFMENDTNMDSIMEENYSVTNIENSDFSSLTNDEFNLTYSQTDDKQ